MPPRNPAAAPKFWNTARKLVEAHPDFVSVTYGAAGGDRDSARTVVETLVQHTNVLPIAHLTCVGATRDNVADTIDDFLAAGARTFLALRGDPPKDQPDWAPPTNGVVSSLELIALLRDVEAQRCQADASEALRGAMKPLTIAVATFPEGTAMRGQPVNKKLPDCCKSSKLARTLRSPSCSTRRRRTPSLWMWHVPWVSPFPSWLASCR